MKYGAPYMMIKLHPEELDLVLSQTTSKDLKLERGTTSGKDIRESSISWIDDQHLKDFFFLMCHKINLESSWNLQILGMDKLQYTTYEKPGDYYGWHVDQREPSDYGVRKISMTLFLSDPEEYDGGELELELGSPDLDKRTIIFKEEKGVAIFFQSDVWHRVLPVKTGSRKSLVAWFRGCPYI